MVLLIKFNYDKDKLKRSKQESEQLLRRIKSILGQFTTENKVYHEAFVYDDKNLKQHIEKLLTGAELPSPHEKNSFDRKIKDMLKNEARNDRSIGYGSDRASLDAVDLIG